MSETPLEIDGHHLTLEDLWDVSRGHRPVRLAPGVRERLRTRRRQAEEVLASGEAVYGVNTGFGGLSDKVISRADAEKLQINLVRSHASGLGPSLPRHRVRALMLIRANSLSQGLSGVSPEVVEQILAFLNADLTPVVPSQGSVGASGDLAPLAHVSLALVGEGSVLGADGNPLPSSKAMEQARLTPLVLRPKDGLALLNGTCLMAASLAELVMEGESLLRTAEIISAVSFDALKGDLGALDPRLHRSRRLPAQEREASSLRALLEGSELARQGGSYSGQDPYVLRCLPQILSATRLALDWARQVADGELNAASDNPLFLDGAFVSGGNFHGQPLAFALDTLALGLSYLGSQSERRSARLVDAHLSRGLPPFLALRPGQESGYMLPPYLAAALVVENASLVHPASAYSLPTSANQEDLNSFGVTAAEKGFRVLENLWRILAVELLLAGEALDRRRPARGGRGTEAAHAALRRRVAPLSGDRPPAPDLEQIAGMLRSGEFRRDVDRDLTSPGGGPI